MQTGDDIVMAMVHPKAAVGASAEAPLDRAARRRRKMLKEMAGSVTVLAAKAHRPNGAEGCSHGWSAPKAYGTRGARE